MIWRISRSRQNTGSMSPARARPVKSMVKRPSAESSPRSTAASPGPAGAAPSGAASSWEPAVMSKRLRRRSSARIGASSSAKMP